MAKPEEIRKSSLADRTLFRCCRGMSFNTPLQNRLSHMLSQTVLGTTHSPSTPITHTHLYAMPLQVALVSLPYHWRSLWQLDNICWHMFDISDNCFTPMSQMSYWIMYDTYIYGSVTVRDRSTYRLFTPWPVVYYTLWFTLNTSSHTMNTCNTNMFPPNISIDLSQPTTASYSKFRMQMAQHTALAVATLAIHSFSAQPYW